MHRQPLLKLINAYRPTEAGDAAAKERLERFVREHADCFERSLEVGHITGAAWLLNADGTRVLLTHHRKLNLWLQLGGHADGDPDVLAVALREAREESGIEAIEAVTGDIFDLDVHRIPAHDGVPAHLHYDVRFLARVTGPDSFRVSDESHDLAWLSPSDVAALDVDESVMRMQRKWLAYLNDHDTGDGVTGRNPSHTRSVAAVSRRAP